MTREAMLQTVRGMFKAATGLADAKVRVSHDDGPRPALPYVTVEVLTFGTMQGFTDELLDTLDGGGGPLQTPRGSREATIQVTGVGLGADDYLQTFRSKLVTPAQITLAVAGGLAIDLMGTMVNIPALRDTGFMPKVTQDFLVQYQHTGTAESAIPVSTIETDYETNSEAGPSDYSEIFTTTL